MTQKTPPHNAGVFEPLRIYFPNTRQKFHPMTSNDQSSSLLDYRCVPLSEREIQSNITGNNFNRDDLHDQLKSPAIFT